MGVLATDDFNRGDGGLGANWTVQFNTFSIVSNVVNPQAGVSCMAFYNAVTFPNDQYSQARFVTSTNRLGIVVRANGSSSGYAWIGILANIYRVDTSVFTSIQSGITQPAAGDTCKLTMNGTTLLAYINGAVANGSGVTSATYASGSGGMYGQDQSVGARIDDWEGGDLAGRIFHGKTYQQAVNRAATY